MRRFLIFGLLGPAVTYLSIDLATRTAPRWWWPQPSIYVVVLAPFLLTAFIDRALKDVRVWERLIVAGIAALHLVWRRRSSIDGSGLDFRVLRGAPCRGMLVAGHSERTLGRVF